MPGNKERQLYSTQLQTSKRSLLSESESDVGSLLSGLSQARKIPDRRNRLPREINGRGGGRLGRSMPKSSNGKKPPRDGTKIKHKNEAYKKEVSKIIKMQAFARGYIVRFAYKSRMTMEKTKRRFFAIQLQASMRGFLERQKYRKATGKKCKVRRQHPNKNNPNTDRTGLGSPQQRRTRTKNVKMNSPKPNVGAGVPMESDSERSEVSIRMERLSSNPPIKRRSSFHTSDKLGESESDVGSIMSNLSKARKVPDRRRKREEKEAKAVVKIQALARGYIQKFLYRSMLAMENTKKKYAAMTIQAYMRGYLQRKNGPEVSRVHVAPKREPPPAKPTSINPPSNSTDSRDKRRKPKNVKKKSQLHGRSNKNTRIKDPSSPQKTMRKPVRHRSGSNGDTLLPRQLTIRKPRRQTSDSEEENHEAPVRHLTIRKPRRHASGSDGSDNAPPRRVTVGGMNNPSRSRGRNNNSNNNVEPSPPRKVMLRVKKGKRPEIDPTLDKSEGSLEPEKALVGRVDRLMSQSNASESKLGESESDVGSLMSGLSQARKVPDRRLKREFPGRRKPKRDDSSNNEKQLERAKSARKIQAIGRGYIARFAYQSRLILVQTKKKFFAIQIQALARGYIIRSRRSK